MAKTKQTLPQENLSPIESADRESALPDDAALAHRIAEAAYYKAENRGFEPGHELEDWLEAKEEIEKLLVGVANED